MLNTNDIQLQPAVLRFLTTEKPCNDLGLVKYFSDADTAEEIAEGKRLCGGCTAFTDCTNYVSMMQDQGVALQGVIAGAYRSATQLTDIAMKTNTPLDRSRECQGCGTVFQAPRTNKTQRFCQRSCRYSKER